MRTLRSRPAIALLVAGLLTAASAASAATLRCGGTGSALGMLRQTGHAFVATSGDTFDVIPSLGSTGALRALADGKLDLVVSARPLRPKEVAAGLRQVLVLRTPFVLATSHPQPQALQAADLPRIFNAAQPVWADGSPIRIILRPRSETDTRLLGHMTPGMAQAIDAAHRRHDIPIAATDQDNLALARQMTGALTATTLTELTTEHSPLHTIPIDGVAPTFANFESGAYRFTKTLHVALGRNSGPAAERFIAFLRSPQGVKALRAAAVLLGGP